MSSKTLPSVLRTLQMTDTERLLDRLQRRLADAPSEPTGTRISAATELSYGRHHGPPPFNAREAAVVVLLYRDQADRWCLPLTVRPDHLPDHPGQICLPGGALEAGESLRDCAGRELFEELGVEPGFITVLGQLAPIYVFASNFRVSPFVAVADSRPRFRLDPSEVAKLLEPSTDDLADRQKHGSHTIRRRGLEFRAHHIEYAGHRIWGATRLILSEFLNAVAEHP